MIVVLLAATIWNKIATPIVMMCIPIVFALIAGYGLTDIASMVATQFNGTMSSVGYMILFSLIYFQMLTETGMFDTIIGKILKLVGKRMNVVIIMMLTTLIALIVGLTTNVVAVYLITFPIVLPLFKRFKMDHVAMIILAQTALCVFSFLPWNYNLALGVAATGCDLNELANAALPWSMCLIPVIILQWVYFALVHKKKNGSLALPADALEIERAEAKENPLARPKMFWVNLLIFVAVILCLTLTKLPSWFIFAIAAFITTIVNYNKNWGEVWGKAANPILNILTMLLAVSAYIAVFNYTPEGGVSMSTTLAEWLVSVVPGGAIQFTTVIFIAILVLLVRVVPYQLAVAMYPMLVGIGATFGIPAAVVIAPLATYIGMGTGVSPMTAATYVSTALAEVDIKELGKRGLVIMEVSVLFAMILAGVLGFWPV